MITKQDAERIIKERQRRLDELSHPEVWDRYTRHMECGEEREFKQSCIDDEIIIEALKPYTSDKPKTHFDRIKAMSVEKMAEAYVELIMQQKGTLEQIENTSATVIEAFKRDLFVQTVMWLESEVQEDD